MDKSLWAIYHGVFHNTGHVVAIYDRKGDAERDIRKEGYKFNKKEQVYINYNDPVFNEPMWYRVETIERNKIH